MKQDGAPLRPVSPDRLSRPFRAGRGALWIFLVLALALQAALRNEMSGATLLAGENPATPYVSSGVWLRRLSLGYEGLAADIYWTRAIQYFGTSRLSGQSQFNLLEPLLSITTTLDPHLIVAYRFGAIFLAEKSPAGAGRPQAAMQLLRRGMAANPDYWRFWEDLGFIEYWDLRDYQAAARYFKAGSQRPGSPIWMKTIAASVAAKGGELRTSQVLWTQ
ncbi:MAG: tetratricopeptide repeat protein, partial [Terriglobia bacterium]